MTVEAPAAPTRGVAGAAGGVPAFVCTACPNTRCSAYQVRRQVWLKQVTVGVVAVPTLLCAACACQLPLSIFRPAEEGDLMPKLHADRPPTDKNNIAPPAAEPAQETAPVVEPEPADLEPTPEPEPEAKPAKKAAKVVKGKASAQVEGLKADG